MSIAELSLRRPVTTIMCFISMVVIGLIASVRLPLEALPDISAPFLVVQLPYTGSTPSEAEQNLLRPAEETLATMSGIKRLRGQATSDGAFVVLEFSDWDRNIAISASEARERIDAIRSDLPDDFRRYTVEKFSTSDQPVLRMRLAANVDLSGSYELIDRQLKRRLERVPGVARVEINGAAPNEVEIAVDPDRLTAHDIELNALATRLRALNFSVSAGQILDGGQRLRVQPLGEIQDLQQLRDLVINQQGLRLSDVADVRMKPQRMDYGRRLDGRAAVGLEIYKERDANLVEVSRNVLAEVDAARGEPGLEGIDVKVIQNMGDEVTSSLMELVEAGAIGLLLSIIVLYFFLRHWPSTLMVTLAIPICFIITLGFMHFFDVTLNVLSLMGLLLAVGMLVDNAVVVVESIYQERERMPDQPWLASVLGTRHVAIALSAGTLCHCIVFVPNMLGETNQISIFMNQLAITISVSLLASWLVAVSLIPMMSARMKTPPAVASPNGLIARMQRRYARILRWSLEHRGVTVLSILLVVAVSLVPMTKTKFDMFGDSGGGKEIQIYYQWKGSYNLQQRSDEVLRFETFLDENRETYRIKQIYSWFGEGNDSGTVVTFNDDVGDTRALSEAISQALPKSARAEVGVGGGQGGGGGGGQGGQGVQVQLVGDSTQVLRELADGVIPMLSANPALRDVRVEAGDLNQELTIRVDRDRAAAFGFSADQVSSFIGLALRGSQLREFRRGEDEVPVWVRFAGAEEFNQADIASFMVRSPDGRSVPLTSLVEMRVEPSASRISRNDRQTSLTLQANLAGETTMPDARKALEQVLDTVAFPAGYGYSFSGSGFEDDAAASQQMMFNLLIAVIMIYVVMAAVFESLLFPAAIMSCVVFSVFGVFWLFWLTGTSFTVMAFIGILVLMGVVVNNGIIMVEHINNLRRRGMSRIDALVEGSRERLRPILMTMGTAILAMIPISLSDTVVLGGLAYSPMARAVAGGLAFSTVVSLLFLPTIYAILDDMRHGSVRLIRRARGVHAEPAAAAG
ncbi:efflux RND transporter permease subunit [Luteimonas fraxinea]|uniref:Efflux RND transporter permease subunit n=1 Tax=Luteimonas fraxinea TaxID=2901869 RepID=A0ABS8UI16_9GAMM|nr:efflux RND transporter permease subunit [Luteimonas fraxinea]MCD9098359.1 efflux RND transporter permease subunit [Luteimonas fraxinea]MCD9127091.1 efflux RND transporter permease subunit [Luteimonas fraxinea]UHH10474.1 efflux RND transporter permease subunit [Luteimonas fraxinea]